MCVCSHPYTQLFFVVAYSMVLRTRYKMKNSCCFITALIRFYLSPSLSFSVSLSLSFHRSFCCSISMELKFTALKQSAKPIQFCLVIYNNMCHYPISNLPLFLESLCGNLIIFNHFNLMFVSSSKNAIDEMKTIKIV